MKKLFKLAGATLCLTMGMAYNNAQGQVSVTFAPQNLNISLTGLASSTNASGSANSFRIATKDVINAVGVSSKNAKLLYGVGTFSDTNGTVTAPVFVVSSGSGKSVTNVLVSQFFSVVTNQNIVLFKGNSGNAILTFGLGMDSSQVFTNVDGSQLTPLTFLVQGFTSFQKSGAFTSKVNGPGSSDNQGTALVLNGTITASAPNKKTITINQ